MFVHTGGGGKGIRPNQHNQQQQQQQVQQQQQLLHQNHHQAHHPTQQQQQQLQVGSLVHHTSQTSTQQTSGNSHPHPQQPVVQHHQQFQHHQVPITFFPYQLSQIHPATAAAAAAASQHQHPGQTTIGNNVGGGPQMAPSPPTCPGNNMSVINNATAGNNNGNNANNMGGNRQQGNNSNSLPHYAAGSALMQQSLPPQNNSHFMTSAAYHMQLQQNTAVMVAAQYNSVAAAAAAAGQHGNPGGGVGGGGNGQATHALYQTTQQTQPPQTHQQATLHYFSNPAVSAAHAQTQLHNPQQHHQLRSMLAAVANPRQPYLVPQGNYFTLSHATLQPPPPRTSLLTNSHQQSTAAAAAAVGGVGGTGGSTVHVATQLQNTATRVSAATGPTTYISPPFCAPPLQMGAGTTLAQQPTSMLAATGIGQTPTLQATYGHISGLPTAATSSTSLNIPTAGTMGVGGGSGSSSSIGTEYKGTKPRKHAIPIIDPITLEKVTFDEPQKRSTVVEVRPPPPPLPMASSETEQSKSKTKSMAAIELETNEATVTMNMENDKSITVSVASAPTPSPSPPPASLTPVKFTKDKIDQQMQTDAVKENPTTSPSPPPSPPPALSLPIAESVQTCTEDPDDTDADTNEHELDNDDDVIDDLSLEQRISASYMDCELTTNLNINQDAIVIKDFELHTGESDTDDHTTETEVKSTSQIDDDIAQFNQLEVKTEELVIESTLRQQDSTHILHTITSQISLEKKEVLAVKETQVKKEYTKKEEKENFQKTLPNKEQESEGQKLPALTASVKNEQKNIKTSSAINVTTTKNKDQTKSIKTANTVITLPPSNSGHLKNSKQNPIVTTQKQNNAHNDMTASKTNQQVYVSNTSASSSHNTNNNNNNNNNNSFITVGKSKNRKLSKRTKENQKKSQQHQQQQQQQHQQKFQEPSSSTANMSNQRSSNAATSNNNSNINNKNSNNNTNLSLSSNAATNILLTDIHNANSSSISSSISGNNLREQNKQQQHQHHQQQQHQQHSTSKSNNNNGNRNSGVGQSKGTDSKNETENQRKHVKTQEIVAILQPTSSKENSKAHEQQLQFLNSSASTCEDEDEKLLKQEQDLDVPIDVHFGDFKENEKLIDTKVTTFSAKGSQNKQKNLHIDTVDCSNNLPPPHTRGGVAAATTIHSKSHGKGGHHNIASTGSGTVHKHKAAKQQHHQPLIRYSLEELKALAVSPQSQKTPVVPCLRNDYISQLFVSDLQQQYLNQHGGVHNMASTNLQLQQQQYQHMNFNESMEFVTGKRRGGGGGGQPRKHYDQHTNAGNINPNIINNMLPGSSAANSSMSGQFPRKMEVIRIHLSLNEEIKLSECANAWQPEPLRSKSNNTSPTAGPNDDIEVVLKKVRGILNKLTPDNFDVLLKTMTSISMNTQEKMQQVMLLIFEKTVSEPNFAPTYAKFCNVLFQEIKPESRKMFNASLIKRIQTEFEVNVNDADAKKLKLQPLVEKMEASTDAKERNDLQAEIEDQEYQFRRRAWGTVRFIGEMYKLQSLTGDRVLLCIESLLEHGSEEKLEYMCKLLTTVGHLLEGSASDHNSSSNNIRMDKIFRKIQDIVNEAKSTAKATGSSGNASSSMVTNTKTGLQTKISSRVRFMMQDVMDLRTRNWDQAPTSSNKYTAPQTQAIPAGTQQQPQQHRRHRQDDKNNQSSGSSSGNYERSGNQRGYANNNQRPARLMMQQDMRDSGSSSGGNYFMQKPLKSQYLAQQEQQSIDLKKLNFSRGDDSSEANTKLGKQSAYMWRQGRPTTAPQNYTTAAATGATYSQQFLGGKGGQQNTNSMNSRNSFKRQTTNQFQVLSTSSRDTEQHMEKSSISASSSSNNDNASDEEDKLYTTKDNQKLLNHLLEEYLDGISSRSDSWQNEVLTSWQAISQKQQISLVYLILMDYLHSAEVKKLQRNACANIYAYLLRSKALDKKTFARAYEQFAEEFPDLLVDVPNGWTYMFEFLGPILHERLLNFSDIWQPSWRDDRQFTERFVNALIEHFTKEFGANYVRDLWHNEYKLDRGQCFLNDQQKWHEFIQKYNLQYIYDCNTKPPQMEMKNSSTTSSSTTGTLNATQEQQVKRLEMLLKTANDCDLAIDYINTNVNVNNNFLRNLTQFLCCDYATIMINTSASSTATTTTISSSNSSNNRNRNNQHNKKNNNDVAMEATGGTATSGNRPHLNVDLFRKNCLPLLRLCLDAQESYELTCLDAVVDSIQQYHDINTANELICGIFDILYDCEVIPKESFEKWYRQRQQQENSTAAAAKHKGNIYKNPLSGQLQQYMQKLL